MFIFSKIFDTINTYKNVIIIVLFLVLGGFTYFFYNDAQGKAAKIAELNLSIEVLNSNIETLEAHIDQAQTDVTFLGNINKDLEIKSQDAILKLEEAKKKINIVSEKPKLIEKLANNKTQEILKQLECITGNCK